jgi:hypothetical protein
VFGLIGVLVVHCLGMASNSKNWKMRWDLN